ncbi:MAG: O-antigen ligase family protein [Methylotenera sp.]|nr:O-antigen ligase family protein [Methylotenera sp.]
MTLDSIKKTLVATSYSQNLHFFVIWLCLLTLMLTWGQVYRFLAYVNLIFVLGYGFSELKKGYPLKSNKSLYYLLAIPFAFITVHFLAVENLIFIREIRHLVLAGFLALGIWLLAKKNPTYIKKNILGFTITLVFIYVAVQAIALWWFDRPYGTTKNPHYLALYSAVAFIIAMYCFFRVSVRIKFLIGIAILLLGVILLHTSSRPTWIGLIFSGVLALLFLNRQSRRFFGLSIAIILIGLTLTNADNFASRFEALLFNLNIEERVVIWQDTWEMQTQSSYSQWLLGHGLDSFEERFKPYSHYHLQNIDFNSPHNFVLELLFISGAIGLLLAVCMMWLIYKNLLAGINNQNQYKNIYLVLLVVITSNLILVGITLPFFTSYNLNIIAIVTGSMLYLREVSIGQMQ